MLAVLNYKELIKNTIVGLKDISTENKNNVNLNAGGNMGRKINGKDEYFVDQNIFCKNCNVQNTCVKVAIPYVLRYLTNELAAMNIRLSYTVK